MSNEEKLELLKQLQEQGEQIAEYTRRFKLIQERDRLLDECGKLILPFVARQKDGVKL